MLSTASRFFRSKVAPVEMAHSTSTKYSKMIERIGRKVAMGSSKGEVLWSVDETEMAKPFRGLVQLQCSNTATSLRCNAAVAYPVLVVWLNSNPTQRMYLTDQRHILLSFFLVGNGRMGIEAGKAGLEKDVSPYGFTSSGVVPFETLISHKFSLSSSKKRISGLHWATLSL